MLLNHKPKKSGAARVPVVIQLEYRECGAACLLMILSFYGKHLKLSDVREKCRISRNGTSAGNIVRAARAYGLNAKGYSLNSKKLLGTVSFPCIIHWDMKHFVVLCGFKNNKAVICSPKNGYERLEMEEFDKRFTGVVIDLSPGCGFRPEGKKEGVFSFLKEKINEIKPSFFILSVFLLLSSIIGIIKPFFDKYFLDDILGKGNGNLFLFILLLSILSISEILISLFQTMYRLKLSKELNFKGSLSYIRSIFNKPVDFFMQRLSGDLMMRQETNANIVLTLINTFTPIFFQAVMMIFYLFIMIRESVLLSAIGMIAVIINLFINIIINEKRLTFERILLNDSSRVSSLTLSGLLMLESIKASGGEDGFLRAYKSCQEEYNDKNLRFIKINTLFSLITSYISLLSNDIVFLTGIYLTMKGKFSLGLISAFLGFLSSFLSPANTIISQGNDIQKMKTDIERIKDVTEYKNDPYEEEKDGLKDHKDHEKEGNKSVISEGNIKCEGIKFSYEKNEKFELSGISFELKKGERLGIVGHSGCGKTTLARLMAGLYLPDTGKISYDGEEISGIVSSYGSKAFKNSVSIIDQDSFLFPGTIKDNITMWDDTVSYKDINAAAEDACVLNDIKEREGFFLSVIKEGGTDLSGGQRQRIEIARALVKNPKVLIMDEATSQMDIKTEEEIFKNIKRRGITTITISHRISTIKDCDMILVMEDGRIKDRGKHDDLLKESALYKRLLGEEKN